MAKAKLQITPYAKNAKKHPSSQIKALSRAIEAFGFSPAIEVDKDGVIVSGHGRYQAAQELGLTEIKEAPRANKGDAFIPYIVLTDLNALEIKQKRLADNKLAETDVDMILAIEELKEIELAGGDITLTGYDADLLIEPDEKEDIIPINAPAIAQIGDLWALGEHRVLCGDSTDANAVEMLMDGHNADVLFTSPPYSDMREYEGGKDLDVGHLASFLEVYKPYVPLQVVNLGLQRKEGEIFPYWNEYLDIARANELKLLAWNVWNREHPRTVAQNTAFIPIAHEWLFVFGIGDELDIKKTVISKTAGKSNRGAIRNKDGTMSYRSYKTDAFKKINSVTTTGVASSGEHPAMFPVALPEEYILAMANDTRMVVDPFLGAGTTLIAAEKTNRICYGMELQQSYVDVIISRWQTYTGKTAVLIDAVDKSRLVESV